MARAGTSDVGKEECEQNERTQWETRDLIRPRDVGRPCPGGARPDRGASVPRCRTAARRFIVKNPDNSSKKLEAYIEGVYDSRSIVGRDSRLTRSIYSLTIISSLSLTVGVASLTIASKCSYRIFVVTSIRRNNGYSLTYTASILVTSLLIAALIRLTMLITSIRAV